jgi:hypothetical protein
MTRALLLALAAGSLVLGSAAATVSSPGPEAFAPSAAHRLAGFALDRESLVLAEDPATPGGCPLVELVSATGGTPRELARPNGPTCRLGGRFWVRPGARAIGVAIVKALWVVRSGDSAIAVKASPSEPEEVLARVAGIDPERGPFLGPVVASNWLRLFGRYTRGPGGTLTGSVISGNRRTLWATTGPVTPFGLDDEEHVVSVGSGGAIATWHAHGARYGRVAGAHARAAAVDHGQVAVLRSDRAQLDVRILSGRLVTSWPVAHGAAPLLDADGGVAVYITASDVHELVLATGRDSVVARAPLGTTLIDAQIERRLVAYAFRGGPAAAGRVLVTRR